MKLSKILSVTTLTIMTSLAQARQAVVPVTSDEIADHLVQEYESIQQTNNLGPTAGVDSIMQWCERKAVILRQALSSYERLMNSNLPDQQKRMMGIGILKAALIDTAFSQGFSHDPFLKKTARKAVVIIQKLLKQSDADLVTVTFIAEKLTRAAVDVAYNFDREYYVPYRYGCRSRCEQSFIEQMSKKAVEYAQDQIKTVLELVIDLGQQKGFRPIGTSHGFLVSAEVVAVTSAVELSENIFGSQVACTIGDLSSLGKDLKDHNAGMFVFGSTPTAVNSVAYDLIRVLDDLSAVRCH